MSRMEEIAKGALARRPKAKEKAASPDKASVKKGKGLGAKIDKKPMTEKGDMGLSNQVIKTAPKKLPKEGPFTKGKTDDEIVDGYQDLLKKWTGSNDKMK